ncbi:MAG: TraR/DksA family transcriptional regulator [Pseudomonadota bacterium]
MNAILRLPDDTHLHERIRVTRAWLLTRAEQLRDRLIRVERSLRREGEDLPRDFSDVAIIDENDEILRGIEKSARGELTHIDHALARIDEGSYALCERCAAEIDAERLRIVPYASECRACARDD